MKKVHFAAIDIGSNAVRLLIKYVNPEEAPERFTKVQLLRVPIRLGEDAFTAGKISLQKRKQMVHLMKAYADIMAIYEVQDYRACATSAMREASNARKLLCDVWKASKIKIEIISGEEEAQLVSGHRQEYFAPDDSPFLLVDVGGGSTELNLFVGGESSFSVSFNIGTIRMLEGMVLPEEYHRFDEAVLHIAEKYPHCRVVGTGGNINKLVRLGKNSISTARHRFLFATDLHAVYNELYNLSLEERMRRYNLKPDRADVIIPAAQIFIRVVDRLEAEGVSVPTSGLADGIIEYLYRRHCDALLAKQAF